MCVLGEGILQHVIHWGFWVVSLIPIRESCSEHTLAEVYTVLSTCGIVLKIFNCHWRSRCLVFDWFLCMCLFFWPRLPATDDCGGDNYSSHVSFPVAACLCSYSPGFSPTFLRCSCAILDGLAFQWLGWPVKTGAASRGKRNVELEYWCRWPWYKIWETKALGWVQGGIAKFVFFYSGEHK